MRNKFRSLTIDEENAVRAFAKAHGRNWKRTLRDEYWYNARLFDTPDMPLAGYLLHRLRNDLGPSWLVGYRLPR